MEYENPTNTKETNKQPKLEDDMVGLCVWLLTRKDNIFSLVLKSEKHNFREMTVINQKMEKIICYSWYL